MEFTISDTVTWLDESGITTAKTSGPGGMGGRDGMGAPEGYGTTGRDGNDRRDGIFTPEGMKPEGK